jgi:hypothetical protein
MRFVLLLFAAIIPGFLCSHNDDTPEERMILEFISPVNGGSWAVDDTIPIEIRYFRDSISRANIEFSIDSGRTFDFIRAQKESEIIEGYSHNYYSWVPKDNGITEPVQVYFKAFNYEKKSQFVVSDVPVTIHL